MTRDEMQQRVWDAIRERMRPGSVKSDVWLLGQVMKDADQYAESEVGLLTPAERRRVIEGMS